MTAPRMAGHERTIEYLGEHVKFAAPPPEGVRSRCVCGWVGATRTTLYAARNDYRDHRAAEYGSGERICTRCGIRKPVAEMAKGAAHLCRSCLTEKTREWAEANPAQFERARRNSHLLKTFGITLDEWELLFAAQGRCCAICGTAGADPRGFAMHTDHDHITGAVRGILCHGCNNGLGNFRDSSESLRAAADYLDAHAVSASIPFRGALHMQTAPEDVTAEMVRQIGPIQ